MGTPASRCSSTGAGEQYHDADALAIAAETYMNLSPWDYYQDQVGLPATLPFEALLCLDVCWLTCLSLLPRVRI